MALTWLNIDYSQKSINELYKILTEALIEEQIGHKDNSKKLSEIYKELSRRNRLDLYDDALESAINQIRRIQVLIDGTKVENFRLLDEETRFDIAAKLESEYSKVVKNDEKSQEMVKIFDALGMSEKSFICEVSGQSMVDANIFEGDTLIVEPRTRIRSGELIVLRLNNEMLVKKYIKSDEGEFLVSENADYLPFKIDEENSYKILGAVTTVIHKIIKK